MPVEVVIRLMQELQLERLVAGERLIAGERSVAGERLMAGEEEWREEEPTSSTHRWTNTDPPLDSFMLFSFAGTWQPSCPYLQMMTWRRWWRRP